MDSGHTAMDRANLLAALARLESQNDHMVTEMEDLDALLRAVGFSEGIVTLKLAVREVLEFLSA